MGDEACALHITLTRDDVQSFIFLYLKSKLDEMFRLGRLRNLIALRKSSEYVVHLFGHAYIDTFLGCCHVIKVYQKCATIVKPRSISSLHSSSQVDFDIIASLISLI